MSAPAPGPNGMMNRTGCCGQACVCVRAGADKATIATRAMTKAQSFDISFNSPRKVEQCEGTLIAPLKKRNAHAQAGESGRPRQCFAGAGTRPQVLNSPKKPDRDARDRIDLEGDRLLVRLDRERRH